MKNIKLFLIILTLSFSASAQNVQTDSLGFQTFEMPDGDTVYTMKKYFLVFLKAGESRSQSPEEAAEIQKAHLAHINWMADEGFVDLAGPFGDDGDIRGILVMRVPTMERAEELAAMDPAVKAGRLVMEIHPWWAAKGGTLR